MSLVYRPATPDDMYDAFYATAVAFGDTTSDERVRDRIQRTLLKPEWILCAFEDDFPVSQVVSVPILMHWNGNVIPAAGVTDVCTLPTHRRQGHLRELMMRTFANQRDAGQSVTILWASMAAIYQRFGWANTFTHVPCDFDPRHLRFVDDIPVPGRVRLLKADDARPVIEPAYRRFAAPRTLTFDRGDREWDWALQVFDPKISPRLVVVYEEDGEALGYAIYRVDQHGEPRPGPDQRITVGEWVWLTPAAHRALVRYFAGYDLADSIRIFGLPEDDPLFYHAQEPRLLGARTADGTLARIVDLPVALSNRGYDADGHITLGVQDDYAPWNTGAWELTVEGGKGIVRRHAGEAQLRMTPRVLMMLICGYQPATTLARIGLISCDDRAALATADAIFHTSYPPLCLDQWM